MTAPDAPAASAAVLDQSLVVLDVEGVLTPEVWIAVAEHTGIDLLGRTTREEPDYDLLMKGRIAALDSHGVTMRTIMEVVNGLSPLPGARDFLDELRARAQVLLLSDTFEQFAAPLMRQLGWPTILCHTLVVEGGRVVGYRLRQQDQKQRAVRALRSLNYRVIAVGDSYNDVTMLAAAHAGLLFRAPANVRSEHPGFLCCDDYDSLLGLLADELTRR